MQVRQATIGDAADIQAIYAPVVANTAISFEEASPSTAEMARRMEAILPDYPYLVATDGKRILGYAYACEHRSRSAYRTSVDVAVYVTPDAHRQGVGRALYADLLPAIAERGFHAAFAGITLPNEASIGLHKAVGFIPVGVYREVGNKFGAWHDVGWWQRLL